MALSRRTGAPANAAAPPGAPSRRKAVRFEMPRGEADSRTLIHLVSAFVQKVDLLRRQAYFGDLDQAIVAGMVGIGSIEHNMYQPEFRDAFGDMRSVVGTDRQRGVNAFSIAQATGIPRETVRRKLKELVARGAIVEKERGRYIQKPGFVQQPENLAAIREVVRHALQMMNACAALGVVQQVETKEP
jgi:hypothetical protein